MISIPTNKNGKWQTTEFSDKLEFAFFVLELNTEAHL